MKILVCGGRHFNNYSVLEYVLDNQIDNCNVYNNLEIVSGGCKGADTLAIEYATRNSIPYKVFNADWTKYGKSAGPIRNKCMIDYIKKETSVVIAFTSNKTIGTRNTIQLARKENIPVIEIPYNITTETSELFEGVRMDPHGNFELDWNNDEPEDLVKLEGCSVHITRYHRNIRFYGYKVNKTDSNKKSRNEFLLYLKSESSMIRNELISRCVEDFYEKCVDKHFDYIVKVPSKSTLNNDIVEQLKIYDSCNVIELVKKPVQLLELDIEKIKSNFHQDYIDKFISYLQKIVDYNKKQGNFSISTFKPQYRKYIKPMISFNSVHIENNKETKLLIVDDIFTSGITIDMVLRELDAVNFEGSVTILTLIQNN